MQEGGPGHVAAADLGGRHRGLWMDASKDEQQRHA